MTAIGVFGVITVICWLTFAFFLIRYGSDEATDVDTVWVVLSVLASIGMTITFSLLSLLDVVFG